MTTNSPTSAGAGKPDDDDVEVTTWPGAFATLCRCAAFAAMIWALAYCEAHTDRVRVIVNQEHQP